MFKDRDSLEVYNPSTREWISLGQYVLEIKYEFPKLFADGSGRNLVGTMISDFIGIFPKITCEFAPLKKDDIELLSPILNSPSQRLRYYDPDIKDKIEIETYTNDEALTSRNIIEGETTVDGFSMSFISRRKRVQ